MTNHRIQPAAALREEAALSGLDPLEQVTRDLLLQIGENPDREGLRRTPLRFARAWRFLTRGYDQDIVEIINNAVFEEDADEMVVVTDIDFFSLCEHHMLQKSMSVTTTISSASSSNTALLMISTIS